MTESRASVSLPTYALGVEAKPAHFTADITRIVASEEAKALEVGDAAFILRSDRKWSYALVTEKPDKNGKTLRFAVDKEQNRKTFPQSVWGKYIRVIKVDDAEMAELTEEAAAIKKEEEEAAEKEADVKAEEERQAEEEKKDAEKNAESAPAKMAMDWGGLAGSVASMFAKKAEKKEEASKEDVKVDTEEDVKAETEEVNAEEDVKEETDAKEEETSEPAKKGMVWEGISSGVTSMFSSFARELSKKIETMKKKEEKTELLQIEAAKDDDNAEKMDEKLKEAAESVSSEPTSTPDEAREDTEEGAVAMAPVPEEEAAPVPMPIKLLRTPISFFKASTMKEDPAEAALAATSFADEPMANLQREGVVVCEKDPESAARAESMARDREYGHLEQQGIIIVETEKELNKQGVLVVESE